VSTQGPLPVFPSSGDDGQSIYTDDYAGWWIRVLAFVLDGVVVFLLAILVTTAIGQHTVFNSFHFHVVNGRRELVPVGDKLVAFDVVSAVLAFGYATAFLASAWRATLFMRLCKIHIARAEDGGAPSLGRVALRSAAYGVVALLGIVSFLFNLLIAVDLLWPLWDARNQTVHDKVARTVVLRRATAG